jgi:hypothetical protein
MSAGRGSGSGQNPQKGDSTVSDEPQQTHHRTSDPTAARQTRPTRHCSNELGKDCDAALALDRLQVRTLGGWRQGTGVRMFPPASLRFDSDRYRPEYSPASAECAHAPF